MTSVKWPDFSGNDLGCTGRSEPYGCSTPEPVKPDPDPGNNNGNGDPQASTNKDESDLPLVPIAAGIVGGLTLILCIIVGVILYKRKFVKSKKENAELPPAPSQKPHPPQTTENTTFSEPTAIYIIPGEMKGTPQTFGNGKK